MPTLFQQWRRRIFRPGPGPTILMYHRISSPRVDPWGLAVQPDRFEQQLAVVRRTRYPLPMSEFVSRLERGTLPDKAVAVTFDDGCRQPARGQPATGGRACAGDTVPRYRLRRTASGVLVGRAGTRHSVGDRRRRCRSEGRAQRISLVFGGGDQRDGGWRTWQGPRTDRQSAYLSAWKHLRAAAPAEREDAMVRLRTQLEFRHQIPKTCR